ncbi:Putative flippase GtrA (Transmembrane translocase of bactoprenol-linked glucose) [Paraburkholderia unamae]|uniref:GtrA family protein n=1 Tax=Paraburkholderia unamae TaxID=219649 RepID=UPI001CB62FFC|nr:GtrA family protein [Paraburkholderia unamae]CAG9245482.1 Putative flippase GtrA (Transmembrane translocase of bactoprenol-linked glucose) [Paraburkholderia unamae]
MPRIIRFGMVGVMATGVHVSVAWSVFNWLVRDATIANVAAFVVANIVSFLMQTLWSFSSRPSVARFSRFATVSAAGFLAAATIPWVCGRQAIWLPTVAVVVCIPALSYVLHARWTYRVA